MINSTGLFSVSQFKKRYKELCQWDLDQSLLQHPADIRFKYIPIFSPCSTEDVKVLSQFEQIEQEIQRELMGKPPPPPDITKRMESMRNNGEKSLKSLSDTAKCDKVRKLKEVNYLPSQSQDIEIPFQSISEDEVVLSVAIYHPTKQTKFQEFLVLGSQYLTDLRDRFYCLSDHLFGETNLLTKSSFFFVEHTFYNDMRSDDSIDYSQCIIDWVNENKRYTQPGLGIFSSKSMSETTFNDLSVRIGAPYLFVHQGNCEHIITFTDLRMIHDQDNKNFNAYPLHIFQSKIRRRKCTVCDIYSAKLVTYGDKLSSENPSFYCDNCYRMLHYSHEGKLLYEDFEVYPYYHD